MIDALGLREECKMHDVPSNVILTKDVDGKPRRQSWNYRSAIGMLNYLASTTRPVVLFSVHQAAKYCSNPKRSHEEAVQRIGIHLKRTSDKGVIYKFDVTVPIEVHVDADFAGTCNLTESHLLT